MAVIMRHAASLSRRRFIGTAAATATLAAGGLARPYLSRAADRPAITHGIQCGDVSHDAAVVWARSDRPARMLVEIAPTERFKTITAAHVMDALPETDLTAKALMQGLPAGQDLFYRVRFADYAAPTIIGEAQVGRFRTAPDTRRSVSFVWSGDAAGQGWGIDEARGGMRTFATMRNNRPDFFIHSGDSIYADCPIQAEQRLPGGQVWRNVVTEEKSKVAETLDEFRGNYKYNLLDRNVRAFNAEVPIFAQWDDHEVTDDWCPNEGVSSSAYRERSIAALVARANQAFHEFMPIRGTPVEAGRIYRKIAYGPLLDIFMLDMRSYRGPNGENRQKAYGPDSYFLGPQQIAWLKRSLKASTATWKVIAADMPIGLYVAYDGDRKFGSEAVAQGDGGPPLGREMEIADLLATLKREGIRNILWITADVHYTAAHRYDPGRAKFQDFDPFWEFVSGPIHAGTYGPNELDRTFGPEVVFEKAPSKDDGSNLPPSAGMQFFGHVKIDGKTDQLTVTLRDVSDTALWSVTLDPIRS
jgi:alkaline phosphatase D